MSELDSTKSSILNIENLTIAYQQGDQWLDAVRDVSLTIRAGETYGLVGESGSGKTTIVLAVMRYLGQNGKVRQGKIELGGCNLLELSETEMRQVWGEKVTMVPQNPQSSLNPSIRIGEQISETLRFHKGLNKSAAYQRSLELLKMVHLADPERVANSYPHQISGGMQQRVMIAMALSTEPLMLILDEPTTSLDVTTQAVILDLVKELIQGKQTAALYVTHNLGVVAQVCDRVAVLYAGDLVEDASTIDLYRQPLHPYTEGLLDSVPLVGESKHQVLLRAIDGQIPPLGKRPLGCVFASRCPVAIEICQERPPLNDAGSGRRSRCHRWDEILKGEINPRQPVSPDRRDSSVGKDDQAAVLKLDDVQVHFPVGRSLGEFVGRQGYSLQLQQN